jgi:hypothetical protein
MDHLLSSDWPILNLCFLRVKKKSGETWEKMRERKPSGNLVVGRWKEPERQAFDTDYRMGKIMTVVDDLYSSVHQITLSSDVTASDFLFVSAGQCAPTQNYQIHAHVQRIP